MSDAVSRQLVLDESEPIKIVQVRGTTPPKALAGSLMQEFRSSLGPGVAKLPNLSLHAIGHQAVCQAVKAVPIANGLLAPHGIQLTILPSFENKMVHSEDDASVEVERTVLRLRLIPWQIGG